MQQKFRQESKFIISQNIHPTNISRFWTSLSHQTRVPIPSADNQLATFILTWRWKECSFSSKDNTWTKPSWKTNLSPLPIIRYPILGWIWALFGIFSVRILHEKIQAKLWWRNVERSTRRFFRKIVGLETQGNRSRKIKVGKFTGK